MNADSPLPRRRRGLPRLVVAIAVVLLCYLASPYFSFWRFSAAIRAGDHDAVAAHVDFPALRESMKRELHDRFFPTPDKPKKKDKLHAFLAGMAPSLIDTLVDAYITPEGLAALLANPRISMTSNPTTFGAERTTAETAQHNIDWSKLRYAFFTSPRDFLVDANGTKLRFRFSLAGWRLRAIDLPPEATGG